MPAIASNITTPLLSLVDVAIVGHIGSAVYIAAIALGGTVLNMCYWVFSFLRMGSSGVTAQAFGAGDSTEQRAIFYRGLCIAGSLAAVLLILQIPLTAGVLSFMEADTDAADLAGRYVKVCIWGAPAVLGTTVLSGWMLGMQYARGPMWMALVTNCVNIATSALLVFVFRLDIIGVAAGTCVAQWIGFIFGLILIKRRFNVSPPGFNHILDGRRLRHFFSINIDIFVRTLCLVAVTLWFTHAGASQGTLVLATNAVLMQFFMLFSYFTDGFAFAGEAMAGKYLGAGNMTTLQQCIKSLIKTGAIVAMLFTAIYFVCGDMLINMLTSDKAVTDKAGEYFGWILTIPLAGFMAFTWDGIFGGLTLTRGGLLIPMTIAAAVFFGLYILLEPRFGNHGLWAAFVAYCAVRGIAQTIYYKRYINTFKNTPK